MSSNQQNFDNMQCQYVTDTITVVTTQRKVCYTTPKNVTEPLSTVKYEHDVKNNLQVDEQPNNSNDDTTTDVV